MICPNCNEDSISSREAAFCSLEEPVECTGCGKYYFVSRVLTKTLAVLYLYSGVVLLVLIFALSKGLLVGLLAAAMSISVFYIVGSIELRAFGLKEKEIHNAVDSKNAIKSFKYQKRKT